MTNKAKERRAVLDQLVMTRARTDLTERPTASARQLGPIAEQANLYVEHVALRAKHYDEAKNEGLLLSRLDPKTIRATKFKNRSNLSLLAHDTKFMQLAKSIGSRGQQTPIRVRPVKDALPFLYEIVAGHRRHAACLALDASSNVGFPVIALIDATAGETIDLVRKMYSENEDRENLSPHETGMMFKHWLDAKIFPTQEAIAAETGQSKQNIGKYVGLASLPDHVLNAFRDPRVISLRWSSELANACESRAIEIQALAEDLAKRTPAPAPETVFAALLAGAAPKTKKSAGARASESIKEGNKVLFELSAREGRYGIRLGKHVDKRLRKDLQHDLKQWLHTWLKGRAAGAGK